MPRESFNLGYNMKEVHTFVLNLQEKIARSKRQGDIGKAYQHADTLVNSEYAQTLAVYRVVTNKGHRSPVVLKTENLCTNKEYLEMVKKLDRIVKDPKNYRATPLDRIYIPKKSGSNLRPLSIPSYTDRCLQALFHLAIEPICEEDMDLSSYGFRPIRSTQWAAGRVLNLLSNPLAKYSYVLEIDILGCYNNIDHTFLMKITPFIPSNILYEWLKCGFLSRSDKLFYETEDGVPQGGIISPLLLNITLDGLERFLALKGKRMSSRLVRYADDIVIFASSKEECLQVKEYVNEFLSLRGLKISEAKSKITHLNTQSFHFVGYSFSRVYRRNKKRPVARISIPLEARRSFQSKIRALRQRNLMLHSYINKANEIIRGWANYYCYTHDSIYIYRNLRYWLWKQYYGKCYKIVKNRYDKEGHEKIHERILKNYFSSYMNYSQWPSLHIKGKDFILVDISTYKAINPIYTNQAKNPYIFEDREKLEAYQLQMRKSFKDLVLKKFKNTCALCQRNYNLNESTIELHHRKPRRFGGSDRPNNLVPLCREPCHISVSNAIISKDRMKISEFRELGILDIPSDYLANNK